MKAAVLLLSVAAVGFAAAQEANLYKLSAKQARSHNTNAADQFAFECGETDGPFLPVGGIVVEAAQLSQVMTTKGGNESVHFGHQAPPGQLLHVEFFADKNGGSFAVVHRQAKEDEAEPPPAEVADDRPTQHAQLCEAATNAVQNGNAALFKALLKAGLQIDLPLDRETGWNPLHLAAIQNQVAMAKMLLRHGADPEVRDKYGDRAIDDAFKNGAEEFCKALERPVKKESMIAGVPESLWEELLADYQEPDDKIRFLSLNEADPSKELLEYYKRSRSNTRPMSSADALDVRGDEKDATNYRDKATKEYGSRLSIQLKPIGDGSYEWSVSEDTGPLSGGGSSGKIKRAYGYWLRYDEKSFDS